MPTATLSSKPTLNPKPTGIYITDRRFIYFMYPFEEVSPTPMFVMCLEHFLTSNEASFIRMHNHTVGEAVTGLPTRNNTSLCVKNKVTDEVQYIISCSTEGTVQLPTRGSSYDDILAGNESFIREQLRIYFADAKKAFAAKWACAGLKILKDGKLEDLSLRLRPKF